MACSCIQETGGFLYENGAEIPSNAVGVPWWGPLGSRDQAGLDELARFITVLRLDREERVDFDLAFVVNEPGWCNNVVLIKPARGWNADRYRFSYDGAAALGAYYRDSSGPAFQSIDIRVSDDSFQSRLLPGLLAAAPLARGNITVEVDCGSCSAEIDAAYRDIRLRLPETLDRWENVLLYSTTIAGGTSWRPQGSACSPVPPGTSWTGRGTERLYVQCDRAAYACAPSVALAPGRHEAQVRAWLPGTDHHVTAETTVDLTCSADEAGVRRCSRPETLLISAVLRYALQETEDDSPFAQVRGETPMLISEYVNGLKCALDDVELRGSAASFRLLNRDELPALARERGSVASVVVPDAWGVDDTHAVVDIGIDSMVANEGSGLSWSRCSVNATFEIVGHDWVFVSRPSGSVRSSTNQSDAPCERKGRARSLRQR